MIRELDFEESVCQAKTMRKFSTEKGHEENHGCVNRRVGLETAACLISVKLKSLRQQRRRRGPNHEEASCPTKVLSPKSCSKDIFST